MTDAQTWRKIPRIYTENVEFGIEHRTNYAGGRLDPGQTHELSVHI